MYVSINHEYVSLSEASILLSIAEQELITAGHTVTDIGQPTPINYESQS